MYVSNYVNDNGDSNVYAYDVSDCIVVWVWTPTNTHVSEYLCICM